MGVLLPSAGGDRSQGLLALIKASVLAAWPGGHWRASLALVRDEPAGMQRWRRS